LPAELLTPAFVLPLEIFSFELHENKQSADKTSKNFTNVLNKHFCMAYLKMRKRQALTKLVSKINGGDEGDRTPDLGIANAALCQTELRPHKAIFDSKIPYRDCQVKAETRQLWSV
jgi:hypothetical protein